MRESVSHDEQMAAVTLSTHKQQDVARVPNGELAQAIAVSAAGCVSGASC